MADFPDNIFDGSIADLNNVTNSTIASIPLKQGEITKEELQTALSTYPIIIKTPLPKPSEMTVANRQLCLTLKENSTNEFDAYICGGINYGEDTYRWYPVANDTIDLSDYVLSSRTIAGISLYSDISVSDLFEALNITKVFVKDIAPIKIDGDVNTFWIDKSENALYYCDEQILGGYNWIKISGGNGESVDLSGYLKKPLTLTASAPLTNADESYADEGMTANDVVLGDIYYLNSKGYVPENDEYKYNWKKLATTEYVDNLVGDVETTLDNIIAIQENLIGGVTE